MDKIQAGLSGIIVGLVLTSGSILYCNPDVDKVKVFQRENKPPVMRMYRRGSDGIYVEDLNIQNDYIKLDKHLERINNEADRNIEEAEIKKTVRWYE